MRDEHRGAACGDRRQRLHNQPRGLGIEVGRGLVGEHQPRVAERDAGHAETPALPGRDRNPAFAQTGVEPARQGARPVVEPRDLERPPELALAGGDVGQAQVGGQRRRRGSRAAAATTQANRAILRDRTPRAAGRRS